MKIFLDKNFYKNYLIYLIPVACSFLFYWRIGEASFWFDELVSLNTIKNTNPYEYIQNYYTNQLNPPLYFIIMKLYLAVVLLLNFFLQLVYWITFISTESLNNILMVLHLPKLNYFGFLRYFYENNIINRISVISEANIRLPSAIFLTAANVLIFDFFKKNKLFWVGILACLLVGLNSKIINFAQDARPYALFILLFLLSIYEFYTSYRKELKIANFKRLITYNLLLVATHYYGVFVIGGELLVLMAINSKNKKFIFSVIGVGLASVFCMSRIFKILNLSRMSVFGEINPEHIKNLFLSGFGNLIGPRFFIFAIVALAIKKYFKQKSDADKIYFKAILLFLLITANVYFFMSIKPIFNLRYILFLVPLQISIIACVKYSISEALFVFIKNENLKKIATISAFIIMSFNMVSAAWIYHFDVYNYYENQKYYPIKSAYEAVTLDKDYKKNVNYILEEYIGFYFKYYEKKFSVKPLINLEPKMTNPEKENLVNNLLSKTESDIIYFIRVRHKETTQQEEPISLDRYSKKLIFSDNNIEAYKFIKQQ